MFQTATKFDSSAVEAQVPSVRPEALVITVVHAPPEYTTSATAAYGGGAIAGGDGGATETLVSPSHVVTPFAMPKLREAKFSAVAHAVIVAASEKISV